MSHEVPARTPELARLILDTAEARGLRVSYLNFSRTDVGVMFDATPTAAQALLWFDDLGAEASGDREYASHRPGKLDRTLAAQLGDDKLTVWVQSSTDDLDTRRREAQIEPGRPDTVRAVDVVEGRPL